MNDSYPGWWQTDEKHALTAESPRPRTSRPAGSVLIADEPTTALDATVQRQVLGFIRELCDWLDMGVLFITHDLGVVAQLADRVAVMYGGGLVETGDVAPLFRAPLHPYTRGLKYCLPIRSRAIPCLRPFWVPRRVLPRSATAARSLSAAPGRRTSRRARAPGAWRRGQVARCHFR